MKKDIKQITAIALSMSNIKDSLKINRLLQVYNKLGDLTDSAYEDSEIFIQEVSDLYSIETYDNNQDDADNFENKLLDSLLNKRYIDKNIESDVTIYSVQYILESFKFLKKLPVKEEDLLKLILKLPNDAKINFLKFLTKSISQSFKQELPNEPHLMILSKVLKEVLINLLENSMKIKLNDEDRFELINISFLSVLKNINENLLKNYLELLKGFYSTEDIIEEIIYQYIYFVKAEFRDDELANFIRQSVIAGYLLDNFFNVEDYINVSLVDLLYMKISMDNVKKYLELKSQKFDAETILKEFNRVNCDFQTTKISPSGLINYLSLLPNKELLLFFKNVPLDLFKVVLVNNCDLNSTIKLLDIFKMHHSLNKEELKQFLISCFLSDYFFTSTWEFKSKIISLLREEGHIDFIKEIANRKDFDNKKRFLFNLLNCNSDYKLILDNIFIPMFTALSDKNKFNLVHDIFEYDEYYDDFFENLYFKDQNIKLKDYQIVDFIINDFLSCFEIAEYTFLLKIIRTIALNSTYDNCYIPIVLSKSSDEYFDKLLELYLQSIINQYYNCDSEDDLLEFLSKFNLINFLNNLNSIEKDLSSKIMNTTIDDMSLNLIIQKLLDCFNTNQELRKKYFNDTEIKLISAQP